MNDLQCQIKCIMVMYQTTSLGQNMNNAQITELRNRRGPTKYE